MVLQKRILARIDDNLLQKIEKKLTLKKYISYDKSKFIRASINHFMQHNLFEYISNINAIITILHDMIIDYNGLNANITQIVEHLQSEQNKKVQNTILNFKKLKKKNIDNVLFIKKLINLLKPFEKQYSKENIIMTRIDKSFYLEIDRKIESYKNINLDMSKFIRASLKYQLDKKYYILSERRIALARELIINAKEIGDITNKINQVAFFLNTKENVNLEEIIALTGALNDVEDTTYSIINQLYVESKKF